MGNWHIHEPDTACWPEYCFTENDVALERGIVKRESFEPAERWRDGDPDQESYTVLSCYGNDWIRSRAHSFIDETMSSLLTHQDDYGFRCIALTGQGSVSKPCYSPFDDDPIDPYHIHNAGGGNFFVNAWRSFANELKTTYSDIDDLVLSAERGHEQLIDTHVLGGKGKIFPSDYLHISGSRSFGEQPLPIMAYLYHGYTLSSYASTSPYKLWDTYQNVVDPQTGLAYEYAFPHLNYYNAMATFLYGRPSTVYIVQPNPPVNPEEMLKTMGIPSTELDENLVDDLQFLKKLIEARYFHAQKFLIYGQALKPPASTLDDPTNMVQIPFKVLQDPYVEQSTWIMRDFLRPRAVLGAWQASDGTVGLTIANYLKYVEGTGDFTLSINMSGDWGIEGDTWYVYVLHRDGPPEELLTNQPNSFTLDLPGINPETTLVLEITDTPYSL
jgi:hypothetical protein